MKTPMIRELHPFSLSAMADEGWATLQWMCGTCGFMDDVEGSEREQMVKIEVILTAVDSHYAEEHQ